MVQESTGTHHLTSGTCISPVLDLTSSKPMDHLPKWLFIQNGTIPVGDMWTYNRPHCDVMGEDSPKVC